MRLLLSGILILTSGTAFASSITPLVGHGGNDSVIVKSCDTCPPVQDDNDKADYKVPVLETGLQKTEVVEIGGEKMLIRTEAFLGGSPVVHVSKVHDWMPEGGTTLAAITAPDGIDHTSKVGAVQATMGATISPDQPAEIDLEGMRLRLN